MNNKLIVFATPIGNIKDVSENFLKYIEDIDVLFCEDTRVTSKLLFLLEVKKKPFLISYHKYNEVEKLQYIIDLIKEKKCGLISDAGYPAISDPGFILIDKCHLENIKIEIINGPSSITHAIAQSGFDCKNFIFLGFLDRNKEKMLKQIRFALQNECPIIIFESVHRINSTIDNIKRLNLDNKMYVGRELTKKFETVTRDYIYNIKEQIEKGEFVIIIDNQNSKKELINFQIYEEDIKKLINLGLKEKEVGS